jgi:hypothetical protein
MWLKPRISWRFLGSVALTSLLFTFVLLLLLHWPSHRVVWQDCQPQSINYGSFDPYYLSVIERNTGWLFTRTSYYLFIAHGKSAPAYGHYLDFSFFFVSKDHDAEIKSSKAEWTLQGVTFTASTGHSLFVPKKSFIGGR